MFFSLAKNSGVCEQIPEIQTDSYPVDRDLLFHANSKSIMCWRNCFCRPHHEFNAYHLSTCVLIRLLQHNFDRSYLIESVREPPIFDGIKLQISYVSSLVLVAWYCSLFKVWFPVLLDRVGIACIGPPWLVSQPTSYDNNCWSRFVNFANFHVGKVG